MTLSFRSFSQISVRQFNELRSTPATALKEGDKFFIPAALTAYHVDNETGATALVSGFYAEGRWGTVKAITEERRRILIAWDDGREIEMDFRESGPNTNGPFLVKPVSKE